MEFSAQVACSISLSWYLPYGPIYFTLDAKYYLYRYPFLHVPRNQGFYVVYSQFSLLEINPLCFLSGEHPGDEKEQDGQFTVGQDLNVDNLPTLLVRTYSGGPPSHSSSWYKLRTVHRSPAPMLIIFRAI